jgi:hypothetical protein
VAEPATDHVDLDAGLQQVHGRRVSEDMGPDPAAGRALVLKMCGMPPDELVDAEPGERLARRGTEKTAAASKTPRVVAGHADVRTTALYDRSKKKLNRPESSGRSSDHKVVVSRRNGDCEGFLSRSAPTKSVSGVS